MGESPTHRPSHTPSEQTTTADILRNKDDAFNDARIILTQRQPDFYAQTERDFSSGMRQCSFLHIHATGSVTAVGNFVTTLHHHHDVPERLGVLSCSLIL